jgi:hypothetical protein
MSPVTTILRVEAEPGQEHLHLLGARVLRLVEDDEAVVQRAAAHERQRRHLDHAALEVLGDPLGLEHVVQRVEQRPQVGVDLRHQVAGQEAEPLAGLDRRTGEDDPVDLAAAERGGGQRDREEGLAGARRADPEGDRVVPDRVDVALLVDRLGRDLGRAVAPDDVLEDARRRLVLVERAETASIVPGAISCPWAISSDSSRTTARAASTWRRRPLEREHVAAQVDAHSRCPRARAARVLAARELGCDCVVELDSATHASRSAPPDAPGDALAVARPSTFAITAFITCPMSLGELAPVSSIAARTSASSSASGSSAGR